MWELIQIPITIDKYLEIRNVTKFVGTPSKKPLIPD